ncbi:uncharacterized protein EI90DRAFT_1535472 [Cantharellus anzutake]|uniref:uncharacterized protein n=1 Tax=Cantharellus anzutake TaxID=1750568 RepID=UPI00190424D7|nr:uncharacterized protein EI90DRAFT_1535472 [Cantharellus anzutake]KAF8328577.1 hypothetical protein EI90DRAFT_1535472 [Cantharellus anzutake]
MSLVLPLALLYVTHTLSSGALRLVMRQVATTCPSIVLLLVVVLRGPRLDLEFAPLEDSAVISTPLLYWCHSAFSPIGAVTSYQSTPYGQATMSCGGAALHLLSKLHIYIYVPDLDTSSKDQHCPLPR